MPKPVTALDELAAKGAMLLAELAPLDHPEKAHKQSCNAFLRDALIYGETTLARVRSVRDLIAKAGPNAGDVARTVDHLAKFHSEPNVPCASSQVDKILRINLAGNAASQMASLKITTGEAVALGVLTATERFPARFGDVDDWASFSQRWDELRRDLDVIYANMRGAFSPNDLVFDTAATTPGERDAGLSRVTFRRFPDLTMLGGSDWPAKFVERVAREIETMAAQKAAAKIAGEKASEDGGKPEIGRSKHKRGHRIRLEGARPSEDASELSER